MKPPVIITPENPAEGARAPAPAGQRYKQHYKRGASRPRLPRYLRRAAALALLLPVLGAGAGSAWSVGPHSLFDSPRLERFAPVGATGAADPCRALLRDERAVIEKAAVSESAPGRTHTRLSDHERAAPLALFGMILGARYATGPREGAMPDGAADIAAPNAVGAVAAYRRCRAEAALETLSN